MTTEPITLKTAMLRGARGNCPHCGMGKIYYKYLKIADNCKSCGEAFHHHRADDFPPYVVILLLGHILVVLALELERNFHPPTWIHAAIWLPVVIILTLLLLPPVKGAIVAMQWHMGMHGFLDAKTLRDEKAAAADVVTSEQA